MNPERLNIVLVDDEPRVLDGLRRQLRAHREKWDMRFANSAEEALAMLLTRPADIVVSDMRMPGMSGGQLLRKVRSLYPHTTRVILSGQTDQGDLLEDVGCIHHYLQKPCDAMVLCAAIERTHLLSERLQQPRLRIAANRITSLPPSNDVYRRLVDELQQPNANIVRVGDLVSGDPALSAKLMQLVNSAFFGAPRKISTAQDAVILLGLKTINALVVTARIFDFIADAGQDQMISALWQSSVQIGESAKGFAVAAGAGTLIQQQARLAGILCLIGRAILLTSDPTAYLRILETRKVSVASLDQLEQQEFGATQDDVAAFALGQWAFADDVVDAVAWQSRPSLNLKNDSKLLACLHLARCAHTPDGGLDECPSPDRAFLESRSLPAQVEQMRKAAA